MNEDLENYIESVDWQSLTHAYGSAGDTPQHLRLLTSEEESPWRRACEELYGQLVHGETRFQASSYTVPAILIILTSTSAQRQASLLELLSSIAIGEDDAYLSGLFDPRRFRENVELKRDLPLPDLLRFAQEQAIGTGGSTQRNYLLKRARPVDYGRLRKVEQDNLASYDAVMNGATLFGDLLTHSHSREVRIWAAYILGLFPEKEEYSAPVLREALRRERDPQVAATIAIALGLIDASEEPQMVFLLQERLTARSRIERWGAAIALAWNSSDSSEVVMGLLDECIAMGDDEFTEVPFYGGCVSAMASIAKRK